MLGKALMHIWNRKLEIAKLQREVDLKNLAHQQAHDAVMASLKNTLVCSGNCPEYIQAYEILFKESCEKLGVHIRSCKSEAAEVITKHLRK